MTKFDLATACRWLRNSPTVAARHDAMTIDGDADLRRAIGGSVAQKAAQQVSEKTCSNLQDTLADHEKKPVFAARY